MVVRRTCFDHFNFIFTIFIIWLCSKSFLLHSEKHLYAFSFVVIHGISCGSLHTNLFSLHSPYREKLNIQSLDSSRLSSLTLLTPFSSVSSPSWYFDHVRNDLNVNFNGNSHLNVCHVCGRGPFSYPYISTLLSDRVSQKHMILIPINPIILLNSKCSRICQFHFIIYILWRVKN